MSPYMYTTIDVSLLSCITDIKYMYKHIVHLTYFIFLNKICNMTNLVNVDKSGDSLAVPNP